MTTEGVDMSVVHPFAYKIEADPVNPDRFRWTVREGSQIHIRSPNSYATFDEADNEASAAMKKLAEYWSRERGQTGDNG
jgi:hypothetical protein